MTTNQHISKEELRKCVAPFVKEWLSKNTPATFHGQRDQAGHTIYTHATSETHPNRYPATVVYETFSWAHDFEEWCWEQQPFDYQVEALSSYEISVERFGW